MTLRPNDNLCNKLCHYSECHYAECHISIISRLSVIILFVVMLSVVAPQKNALIDLELWFQRKMREKKLFCAKECKLFVHAAKPQANAIQLFVAEPVGIKNSLSQSLTFLS